MIRIISRCTRVMLRSTLDVIECTPRLRVPIRIIHCEIPRFISFNTDDTGSTISYASSNSNEEDQSVNDVNDELEQSDWEYERDVKCAILDASLSFVPAHGWTKAALVAGAQSVGYPGVVTELFPLGGASIVLFYYEKCNLALREYLKENEENQNAAATCNKQEDEQEQIKSFIADAMEMRLSLLIPIIDKWPAALATLATPSVVPHALTNLFNLVDDIAYYAADRSANLDWYIRRVGIAGIYKITELYMLQDKSDGYVDTWTFLKRQLDDAVTLYSYIKKSESAAQFTKDISTATLITARNMLGLKWSR